MTVLFLAMAGMLLIALLLLLLPRLGSHSVSQQRLNTRLYEARRQELLAESQQGLVDETRLAQMDIELKRSLLDDAQQDAQLKQSVSWKVLLPGAILLLLGSVVLYWQLGSYRQLAHWQEVDKNLPALAEKALHPAQGETLSQQQMQDLALGIRSRLASKGDDKNAWIFLARVGFTLGETTLAADAYNKALAMDPDNTSALLGLAQVKLMSGEAADRQDAAQALARLLTLKPEDTEALLLSGFVAYQNNDFSQALSTWQQLLKALPEQDPRRALLASRIADVKRKMAGSKRRIVVTVDVTSALKKALPAQATLFVFARPVAGGPPLAAVKVPLSRLPAEVELSDNTSMIPGRSLSDADTYQIGAQISQSGNVFKHQPGDLRATAKTVSATDTAVKLMIDQRIQ
ncbi:c-type cytochrome biogenesis protein CcmI [Gallaecimonas sp. GXIMD1310]|uniref:c-type cytochrome biogenesis protein CcmI n=1 Tax=Gallaecimonas sp. GXIMD1310 TaxID=3131926 RepID=UPI00324BF40B